MGCVESHRAFIYDRGGRRRISELTRLNSIEWGRVRDGKSKATIQLLGEECKRQRKALQAIESSRHELVVFRGDERVWEGPVRSVKTGRESFELVAADVLEYLDYTSLSKEWPAPATSTVLMGDRVEEIIQYELTTGYNMRTNQGSLAVQRWEQLDPPINLLPYLDVRPGTIYTTAGTEAFQMTVGEYLDDRAEGGLDYTAVGRRVIIWDSDLSIGQTRTVTDADFYGEITVTQSGTEHVSIAHLSASRDEDEDTPPRVGHAGGPHDYYGVWETIVSQQSEEGTAEADQTALNSQAQRALTHKTPVPLVLAAPNGIRLSNGLGINDLVPGVTVPVTANLNLRPVSQIQVIDEMSVSEDENGESISVKLSPWGDVEGV